MILMTGIPSVCSISCTAEKIPLGAHYANRDAMFIDDLALEIGELWRNAVTVMHDTLTIDPPIELLRILGSGSSEWQNDQDSNGREEFFHRLNITQNTSREEGPVREIQA